MSGLRTGKVLGKRITIEEFGGMLEPWEGWHFQLKILDRSDADA